MLHECTQYPHGGLLGISKDFCNVSVNFLGNYKKGLFSGNFVYKLENEEIYTEQIFFLPYHRFWTREKTSRKCKSAGYKKTRNRAGDGYVGLSKRQVLKCLTSNEGLKKLNVRFANKAKHRPVSVKRIQEQHQIDLVDMKSMKVEYKRKRYRYIFSLMGIFSRFHWLAPLTRKKSSHVKKELQRIYKAKWERLQSENGGELKRQVKDCCKSRKIKMINCRSYNPKAQGKVEHSHRSLRQKT